MLGQAIQLFSDAVLRGNGLWITQFIKFICTCSCPAIFKIIDLSILPYANEVNCFIGPKQRNRIGRNT